MGLVLLFFFCTSALYTYPLIFHLPRAALVGQGDILADSSLIAWNAHQFIRSPLHLFDSHFFYPHSNTFAYAQPAFFSGLLAVPLWAIVPQTLLVTNILMLLAFVLSGVFMYLLAFSLTECTLPSLLAGVAFSYFPNRMDHLGQVNVQMGFLLPLILWAFYRFLLERRWRDLFVTVLGIWAQALSTIYYAFPLQFLLLGFLAAFLLLRPGHLSWSLLAKGAVGLLLLGALLAPFLTPYLDVRLELGFERNLREAELYGMDLLSILDPGVSNKLYGLRLVFLHRSEGGLFPGFIVLGLVAVAVCSLWRNRTAEEPPRWTTYAGWTLSGLAAFCLLAIILVPWLGGLTIHLGSVRLLKLHHLTLPVALLPLLGLAWIGLEGRRRRRGPLTPREWIMTLLFLTLLMYLFTLTPTLTIGGKAWGTGLFTWLYSYVPGTSAFRAPGRWALLFVLPLALLASFGARALSGSFRDRLPHTVSTLLLLGVMAEYVCFPIDWQLLSDPPPVYRWLEQQFGDFALLELPVEAGPLQAWYMFWGTVHWKRLIDGAFGFVPPTIDELVNAPVASDLRVSVARLQSIFPLRYLVVHWKYMPLDERSRWGGLRSTSVPGVRFLHSFDGDDVYAVSGTPQAGVDLHRYFSSDFVRRHPVAEYDLRLTGEDTEVRRWVKVSFNGRALGTVTEGGGAVRLAPPYKEGDRNILRFLHRYELTQPTAGKKTYRIGQTFRYSPVDIQVVSAGNEHGNISSIRINGLELSPTRRGYNIVTLEPRTGKVVAAENFDTFRARKESQRMARFVENLPPETIVLASVMDDGSGQLTEEGVQALRSLGGREDIRGRYRVSHLLIGVKGARPGEALEASGPRRLVATVGRDRDIGMILRSFTLR